MRATFAGVSLPEGCRQLLTEIHRRLPRHQAAIRLRQIDLATVLRVNPVTIRRRTRQLQNAGLLLARRGKNIITYTVLSAESLTEPGPAATAQPELIRMPTPAPAAPQLAIVQSIGPKRDAKRANRSPRCPQHRLSRTSWMTTALGVDLYHCPAATGAGKHCSWIYSPEAGQINAPGLPEMTADQVKARLLQVASPPAPASVTATPTRSDAGSENDTEPERIWRRITAALEGWAQPDEVQTFLSAARGISFDGNSLEVKAARPSHLRWLQHSFAMRFIDDAIKQALGKPIKILYLDAEAPA